MTVYNDWLSQYIVDPFAQEDPALQQARLDPPKMGLPPISVEPKEGRFLKILVHTIGAQSAGDRHSGRLEWDLDCPRIGLRRKTDHFRAPESATWLAFLRK
jgi:hypothetical protein